MSCHQSPDSYGDYAKEESYESMAVSDEMEIVPQSSGEPTVPYHPAKMLSPGQAADKQDITPNNTKAQKIIKSGSVIVDVDNLQAAKSALDQKIKSLNGYYESENFQDGSYNIEYHLSIRVPTDGFDKLLSSLDNNFGQIVSKEINAKDVTEEYVDLGIRL